MPFGPPDGMWDVFAAAHRQRFGFVPDSEYLLIDRLTAEAIGVTGEPVILTEPPTKAVNIGTAQM